MTRGVFVAGANSSASELNDCFDPPRAKVYNSGSQSLANATDTLLTFDSELEDVGGLHSTSVNTGRFTIPSGGQGDYDVSATVRFATNATGTRRIGLWKNGATTGTRLAHVILPTVSGVPAVIQLEAKNVKLAAGDYIEITAYQDSGGALNAENGPGPYAPLFSCRWVAVY